MDSFNCHIHTVYSGYLDNYKSHIPPVVGKGYLDNSLNFTKPWREVNYMFLGGLGLLGLEGEKHKQHYQLCRPDQCFLEQHNLNKNFYWDWFGCISPSLTDSSWRSASFHQQNTKLNHCTVCSKVNDLN